MRMRSVWLFASLIPVLIEIWCAPVHSAEARQRHTLPAPVSRRSTKTDQTIPLRDMKPLPIRTKRNENEEREVENRVLPKALASIHKSGKSTGVVANTPAAGRMPSTFQDFDGTPNLCGCLPPDTNGDVGPAHYVQMVNDHIQIFDKSGNSLLGPEPISTLWQGFGGACENQDDGDPIVLYDQLADRWLVSQFAIFAPDGHNHQCIAVSQTGDPTGSYNRYDFDLGALVNDYPHIGVWPDGYYMTVNQFNPDFSWAGAGVYSFERGRMLLGQPAQLVYFNLFAVDSNFGGMLPSDLDGPAPAAGTPNIFAEADDDAFGVPTDRLDLWEFHVDWATPANSTFGIDGQPNALLDTAPFDANMCNFTRSCIPQPGTNQGLDAITDRLMHRLQYRAFAGYSTIVGNHTVDADGNDHAGIDWFELRNTGSGWAIHQEGIYAPDSDNRWMASAAMDSAGNIAIGYSVSSNTTFPSIRYTGRLASDPPGQLTQGENTIIAGTGSQLADIGRWGDYSGIAVDPSPGSAGGIDCDFWYTNEYLQTTGGAPWRTRVGAFTFAPGTCGGPHGDLQGTVTDSTTTLPIAGATVEVQPGGFSTTTDAGGHYHFNLSAPVTYDVTASGYGYFSQTHNGVGVTDGGTTTDDFALDLAPHSIVSGTITDGSGHGWPLYARIDIAGYPFGPIFTNPLTGAYTVDLIQDALYTFNVHAISAGYNTESRPVTPVAGGSTEDFALTVNFSACNAPGYAPTGGAFEYFDSDSLPAGWSVVDNLGNGEVWTFLDPEGQTNNTGGSGLFAVINSDFYGETGQQDTELRSPVLDFSTDNTVRLAFDMDFIYFGKITPEIGDVDVSTDGGSNWTNVRRFQNGSTPGPHHEDIDISALAAHQSNVMIRFHYYNAVFAFWWQVDDFQVGVQCDPIPGGMLAGNVYDGNTNLGLNGATVSSNNAPSETVMTFATPLDPNVDDGFYMLFSSLTGNHPFTASRTGYAPLTQDVNVTADQVVAQNFNLDAGQIVPAPTLLEDTVALGGSDTLPLTLNNTGGAPAGFQLFEGAGNTSRSHRAAEARSAPLLHTDGHFSPLKAGAAKARTKHDVNEETEEDAVAAPDAAPWTGIANYPVAAEDTACAEIGGLIYCAGGIDSQFATLAGGYVYDPGADSWSAIADLPVGRDKPAAAAIGGKLYVAGGWASSGDPLDSLEIYDPASNSWTPGASMLKPYAAATGVSLNGKFYVIGGCDTLNCGFTDVQVFDPGSGTWSAAAAYPEAVSWSACGAIDGQIYCAGGSAGQNDINRTYAYDPAGDAWTQLANMPLALWGSAYVAADDRLYVSGGVTNHSSTVTNQGFAYDPSSDSWTPIANAGVPIFRGGSACGFYRIGGSLGLQTTAGAEVYPGLSSCSGSVDVPWLNENPVSGTVPANAAQPVAVTFDAGQVTQPGDYFAHLHIKENTPYATPDVQVILHVPLPAGWGYLAGSVAGMARCDTGSAPLNRAIIVIDTNGTDYTVQTDGSGHYVVAYNASDGPATLTVSAGGYVTQTRSGVQITAGQTHDEDFTLRLDAPCVDAQPALLEATVPLGSSSTLQLTLSNSGAAAADFELLEGHGNTARTPMNPAAMSAPLIRIEGHYSPLPAGHDWMKTSPEPEAADAGRATPWMAVADYPTPIVDNTCAEIDGLIYCVGGVDSNIQFLNKGYVYDPGSNSWSPIADMSFAREKPAATAIDGKLYVTAGWSSNGDQLTALEIYDPLSDTWDTGAPIPTAYGGSTGANLNGKFYVIGGCDLLTCGFTNVQVYDPASDTWSIAADYPEPTSWNSCGAIGGLLYCAGGVGDATGDSAHTYVYNPDNDSWTQLADMPQTQWGAGFIASDQLLYISGGITDNRSVVTNEGFAYDPSADQWTSIPNSNNAVFRGGSACGFYKMGGSFTSREPNASSEVLPGLTNCGRSVDLPWLSENPESGSLAADTGQQTVNVTLDAGQVNQPGDYPAHLRIRTSYAVPHVQVVMHVPVPADWGTIQGTVNGLARCDVPGSPLKKATVFVDTAGTDYTLKTDSSGQYRVSFPAADSPATITVIADGYVTQVLPDVVVTPHQVVGQDFSLRIIASCANKSPVSFDVSLGEGESTTLPLTLSNTGARDMNFEIRETLVDLQPLRPNLKLAAAPAASGQEHTPGPSSLRALQLKKEGRSPLASPSAWFGGLPLPGGLARYARAQCDTQPNSFYVFSGVDGVVFDNSRNSWRYDVTTNSWTALARMPAGSQAPVATCYQGRIYVMGGIMDGFSGSKLFYIYDIASDTWLAGAPLPRAVWGAAAGSWNGKVFLIGGDQDSGGGGTSSQVSIYDIATNTWTGAGTSMPFPTFEAGFVQAGSYLYVVGGWQDGVAPDSNVVASQRYDMSTDTWTTGPNLPSGRADFALTITDTALYAMGGDDDGNSFFNPTTTVTRLEWAGWPGGDWTDLGDPIPGAYQGNSGGFCTQALAAGSEIWSLGGLSDHFSIDGVNLFLPLQTEHCFSIFGNIPWLSVSPGSGNLGPDSNNAVDAHFDAAGLAAGDYHAVIVVSTNDAGAPEFHVPVTLHVGLFHDDFNDGNFTTPAWTVTGPAGAWNASSGDLVGTTTRKIDARSPDFGSGGCTNCTVTANMVLNKSGERLSLFGWRAGKDDSVEVRLSSDTGKFLLLQKSGGRKVAKHVVPVNLPAGDYTLQVSYDGINFNVQLSGAASAAFTVPSGAAPHGTLMFRVKSAGATATGTLKDVTVF